MCEFPPTRPGQFHEDAGPLWILTKTHQGLRALYRRRFHFYQLPAQNLVQIAPKTPALQAIPQIARAIAPFQPQR